MDFNKKILILFIIIIFIYIIIRLIIKRIQIKQAYEIEKLKMEGYSNSNVSSLQDSYNCPITIKNNLRIRLNNINIPNGMNLQNYAIKASINSAYNGKENNTDMINLVLSRGCRFLDFEVYKDSITSFNVVSISKTKDDDFIPLDNKLTISDALNYVNMYGFNSTCPNYGDPLFIQIRLKCNDTDKESICYDINNILTQQINPLYNGKITKNTSMMDLIGKIIIVMDTKDCINGSKILDINRKVNLYNNNLPDMQTFLYDESLPIEQLKVNSDMYTCSVSSIRQILFNTYTNVNSYDLFNNYSIHILPMMFWDSGIYLCNYEGLFNECGGGIVPLSSIYYKLKNKDSTYISYPDPLFTSSNYNDTTISIFIIFACLGTVGFIIAREYQ